MAKNMTSAEAAALGIGGKAKPAKMRQQAHVSETSPIAAKVADIRRRLKAWETEGKALWTALGEVECDMRKNDE